MWTVTRVVGELIASALIAGVLWLLARGLYALADLISAWVYSA